MRHQRIRSLAAGNCPFRGLVRIGDSLPQHVKLDDRCPDLTEVRQAHGQHTTVVETEEGTSFLGLPPLDVPVLETGSYCHDCVYGLVREREMGLDTGGLKGEKRRGR